MLGQILEKVAGPIIDRVIPDKNAAARAKEDLRKADQAGEFDLLKGQLEINKVEAASSSLWVSGWRPATGWIANLCMFLLVCAVIHGHFTGADYQPLFAAYGTLVAPAHLGMLGLRTFERRTGVAKER